MVLLLCPQILLLIFSSIYKLQMFGRFILKVNVDCGHIYFALYFLDVMSNI